MKIVFFVSVEWNYFVNGGLQYSRWTQLCSFWSNLHWFIEPIFANIFKLASKSKAKHHSGKLLTSIWLNFCIIESKLIQWNTSFIMYWSELFTFVCFKRISQKWITKLYEKWINVQFPRQWSTGWINRSRRHSSLTSEQLPSNPVLQSAIAL